MTKSEACQMLADINEKIYDVETAISDIESRLAWDDESRKEWYLERKEALESKLYSLKCEHDNFMNEYSDIIYS